MSEIMLSRERVEPAENFLRVRHHETFKINPLDKHFSADRKKNFRVDNVLNIRAFVGHFFFAFGAVFSFLFGAFGL